MKRNTKKTLGLVSFPVFAATLASCASAYLGAEVPTVAPRNVEQMKGDRSVNLVLLCESPWDDPTLCDELNRAAQQGVLESGVFTNLSIAENAPRDSVRETCIDIRYDCVPLPSVGYRVRRAVGLHPDLGAHHERDLRPGRWISPS